MDLSNKKAVVIGVGLSGISACKLLSQVTNSVTIYDSKKIEDIKFDLSELKEAGVNIITGENPDDNILQFDLVVLSPSVPLHLPFIQKALENNIKVIPEIELSFLLQKGKIIGITGTNGKTTTTNLIYNIFSNTYNSVFETGNIGKPVSDYTLKSNESSYFITELSSYMLETIVDYKVNTAIILNITEDHILRHKNMENYIKAKMNILNNQDGSDSVILNLDDSYTANMKQYAKGKVYFFSATDNTEANMYIKDGYIFNNIDGQHEKFIDIKHIKILGVHNLYNIMASIIASKINGIKDEIIINTIKGYMGVEHRIEFVKELNEVCYYNDSKATNVDASLCAIDAMIRPTILIAGGDEKNVLLDDLIIKVKEKVKFCIFVGKTKEKLKDLCLKYGYSDFYVASSYEDAVKYSKEISKEGDCVLLSPACASFDMFSNFEERGKLFKELVLKL